MGLFWVSEELNNNIFKSLLNTTSLQNESDATIFVFARVSEGLGIFPPVARPFHGQVMERIGNACITHHSRAKTKIYESLQVDGLNDCLVLEDLESEGFVPLSSSPAPTSLLAHVHAMLRALAEWHALSLRWG